MGKNDTITLGEGAKGVSATCTNIIFILDTSYSMEGERIKQLNYGMKETLNALVEESIKQETDVYVRVIKYNSDVKWVIGSPEKGILVDDAARQWKNMRVDGSTDTAAAINESLKALRTQYLGTKNKKPIIILFTDGESDNIHEMKRATNKLKTALSGESGREKTVRVAIGVSGYAKEELDYFASVGTIKDDDGVRENVPFVFSVNDANKIATIVKNVTVSSLKSVGHAGPVQMDNASGLSMDDEPVVIDTSNKTTDFWGEN